MTCANAQCWCRQWPPVRWIPSMDLHYTVDELPRLGNDAQPDNVRVFAYRHIERTTA